MYVRGLLDGGEQNFAIITQYSEHVASFLLAIEKYLIFIMLLFIFQCVVECMGKKMNVVS
jgi:hypothetical protein